MNEGNYTVSEDGITRSDGLKLGKKKLELDIKKKSLTATAFGQCEKSLGVAVKSPTPWGVFEKKRLLLMFPIKKCSGRWGGRSESKFTFL